MLTCKEATHLLSEGHDRQLGLGERIRLRIHLAFCAGCTRYQRQLRLIRQACSELFRDFRP